MSEEGTFRSGVKLYILLAHQKDIRLVQRDNPSRRQQLVIQRQIFRGWCVTKGYSNGLHSLFNCLLSTIHRINALKTAIIHIFTRADLCNDAIGLYCLIVKRVTTKSDVSVLFTISESNAIIVKKVVRELFYCQIASTTYCRVHLISKIIRK